MNSKQLIVFREVMLTGSFSEAARNLNRTQPAISAMISSLERDLGCELFIRRGGRLHPVPEALYLLEETKDILDRIGAAQRNMQRVGTLERGELRIVSMPGPSVILLPQLIGRFVATRKEVHVKMMTQSSLQVQRLVASQQFDLGLADLGYQDGVESNLISHDMVEFNCVCAIPADDPIAQKGVITPEDLSQRTIASLLESHPVHTHLRNAFEAAGLTFAPRYEAQYFFPLLSFVSAGLACAIVDPLTQESYRLMQTTQAKVVFRPFRPNLPLVFSVVTPRHRQLPRLALLFAELLKAELMKQKQGLGMETGPSGKTLSDGASRGRSPATRGQA